MSNFLKISFIILLTNFNSSFADNIEGGGLGNAYLRFENPTENITTLYHKNWELNQYGSIVNFNVKSELNLLSKNTVNIENLKVDSVETLDDLKNFLFKTQPNKMWQQVKHEYLRGYQSGNQFIGNIYFLKNSSEILHVNYFTVDDQKGLEEKNKIIQELKLLN